MERAKAQPSTWTNELAATIQFESGDLDGAYTLFEPQYRKYGRRVFEGHKKVH